MSALASSPLLAPAELPVRAAARAIDFFLLAALEVALGQLIGFGFDWLAIGTALVLAYFVFCDAYAGTTIGKAALGLRVIAEDGGHPSLRQAVVREAFTVVGSIVFIGPLLAIAAWIWIALSVRSSPLRQGKHDLLAGGTRVVRSA